MCIRDRLYPPPCCGGSIPRLSKHIPEASWIWVCRYCPDWTSSISKGRRGLSALGSSISIPFSRKHWANSNWVSSKSATASGFSNSAEPPSGMLFSSAHAWMVSWSSSLPFWSAANHIGPMTLCKLSSFLGSVISYPFSLKHLASKSWASSIETTSSTTSSAIVVTVVSVSYTHLTLPTICSV